MWHLAVSFCVNWAETLSWFGISRTYFMSREYECMYNFLLLVS